MSPGLSRNLAVTQLTLIKMTTNTSAFTELGFEINNFKFSVKIPKLRLKKPKLLRRRRVESVEFSSPAALTTCSSRFQRKYESYVRSDQHSSVSTDPSFTSDEWIKEFNARCKSVPKIHKSDDSEDEDHQNFYSNVPSATSTPVNCKIVPLNRLHLDNSEEERKSKFLPNISGIKIYETVDMMGSDGNEHLETSSDELNNSDYETVHFKNHVMTPKTLFKPRPIRTLKSKSSRKH